MQNVFREQGKIAKMKREQGNLRSYQGIRGNVFH